MNISQALSLAFPQAMLVILIVCAYLSAVGFFKFVYFFSVGYGFAIAGSGVAMLVMYSREANLPSILLCFLFIIYGVRLSGFLLVREFKSTSYRKTLNHATGGDKPMPIFVKAAIWIPCFLMYTTQVSPVLYRMDARDYSGNMPVIGVIIMTVAILIESIADRQKSQAKIKNPNRFCDTGLYKIVRCPNYLGEVLFWTGVLVSGFGALRGVIQWAIAVLGYLLLIYVMFSGAKRLETRQNKNYWNDPEYQRYVKKTPILLPYIPLYSLQKADFIK